MFFETKRVACVCLYISGLHIPDRRSTLYWNPYLLVSSDGKAFIEFYSDDSDDPRYEITIEGVTPEGIPVHYRSEVRTE